MSILEEKRQLVDHIFDQLVDELKTNWEVDDYEITKETSLMELGLTPTEAGEFIEDFRIKHDLSLHYSQKLLSREISLIKLAEIVANSIKYD